jgi:electron transfer flavoprotein alpha/beta subunit
VVTSKVMEAMKTATIEELAVGGVTVATEIVVSAMALPESGRHAEMIAGNVQQVAEKLARLLRERGLVAGRTVS